MRPATQFEDPNGNTKLHVYYARHHLSATPTDIQVYIDGRTYADRRFSMQSGQQDQMWRFSLADGPHTIRCTSKKANKELTQNFEVKGRCFIVVTFVSRTQEGDAAFQIFTSDEPIPVPPPGV